MSLIKAIWTNGFYSVVCNIAESRASNEWEPQGNAFPGGAGVINPWDRVSAYGDDEGNRDACVIEELNPQEFDDRRGHVNFLAKEPRPELYCYS